MIPNQTVEWKIMPDGLKPFVGAREIAWAPQPGSQTEFISCPIDEVLYEGTRGPGKTDALLMAFYMECGKGYGAEWRGILFRRTYPELQDVIEKSQKWFAKLCPAARYNHSEHVWTFPDGEKLFLRHFDKPSDYWKYHGHAYPFLAWEELCTWPTDEGYKKMMSTNRSTCVGMPRKIRATANPYGVGHNWVKARFKLPIVNKRNGNMVGPVIRDADGERVAIHGELRENKVLLHADPQYVPRLRAAASNEAELRAWLYGDWNIVAGGMFDDVWDANIHVVPNIPLNMIPRGWRFDRSFDWGQSKPFSVGWWAESNGESFEYDGYLYGRVRGDLIRVAEWYGCGKKPNTGLRLTSYDIGVGVVEREVEWGIRGRVLPGPADTSIFDDWEPGKSVAGEMIRTGVGWERADKARKQGWEEIRKMLKHAKPTVEGPREHPGLFVCERCVEFQRTVPVLSRKAGDMDDVDTDAEDHIADETRYRVRRRNTAIQSGSFK